MKTDIEVAKEVSYRINLQAIQDAKPGSDLYGVLEKTAFHLCRLTNNPDNIKNWFNAQVALADCAAQWNAVSGAYAPMKGIALGEGGGEIPLSDYLTKSARRLSRDFEYSSRFFRAPNNHSQFDFWMLAQDTLARSAVEV